MNTLVNFKANETNAINNMSTTGILKLGNLLHSMDST